MVDEPDKPDIWQGLFDLHKSQHEVVDRQGELLDSAIALLSAQGKRLNILQEMVEKMGERIEMAEHSIETHDMMHEMHE